MGTVKNFYKRYWEDRHIKVNLFDYHPGEWTDHNFLYHLKFFKPFIKGRLLDFGCDNGDFLNKIKNFCVFVSGVDISQEAVELARIKYPDYEFKVLEDGMKMPYPDSCFDTVCVIDVLEHILDIEGTLEEISRVLKPGGNLLIAASELIRLKLLLIILTKFDSYFYPTSPHIRYFTRRNLDNILRKKGFRSLAYKKTGHIFILYRRGRWSLLKKIESAPFYL